MGAVRGTFNYVSTTTSVGGYTEILKFPAGLDAIQSVTIDASTVATAADGNRVLKAGTLLFKNGSNQYQRFAGSGTIKGVLAYDVEVVDTTANSDLPAAMFFHGCVFRSDRIIDFGTYGSTARTALPTCRFD